MREGLLKSEIDSSVIYKLIIAAAYVVFLYIVFSLFGKDKEITPVVNFNPPSGLDPAAVGYLIDSTVSPTDMTSLIYYWASQGHLHIKDEHDGANILLIKVSELDEKHTGYERIMFTGLFKSGVNQVYVNSLKEKYYSTLSLAQTSLRNGYSGKLYSAKASSLSVFMMILTVLMTALYVFICGKTVSSGYSNKSGFVSAVFLIITYLIATGMIRYEPKILKSKQSYYLVY
jgi:hypothetical protein